jgi:hypothetical protein
MWVNAEVDALVRYTRGLRFPSLQAIRWDNRRIDLKGPAQVERGRGSVTTESLSAAQLVTFKEGGPDPGGPGPRFAEGVVCSGLHRRRLVPGTSHRGLTSCFEYLS